VIAMPANLAAKELAMAVIDSHFARKQVRYDHAGETAGRL